ncbi:MAG: hypothetical protein A2Y03_04215 [Omnitrophica WOR_2 bacterium GWF2_38_59]|nr:MAG: hypothetical protein A2Y03_04215 [Omnitrophica WOR_2 bacterium GWF2_38_59]OGX50201.1 MAG: hypothetical protein A2243_08695 [Omnitrophica WOR_2 bacterium RIFOXYA2_FULL_38_17]OGX52827.1 MAG: hypothetical protein A2267_07720 [Omnitrophica WOR_2 bacterium RIFOXYA12_FULL_38_10]OGX57431.1 MAG: hypothetical protein A2306_02885 [Omnitrophica WOR_2 bacterium RIFOXYB2_FULL_38_16]OGX57513.1 MAG: hypothetical protein A2447_03515 [Omnitrophica WOR_2 bacterium RIFOXYC2_FULL_38_12]HBG60452.1 hypothet
MKNTTKIKFFPLLCVLAFSFIPFNISYANDQVSGEIININYKYKVAFTDLSNLYLQNNDIVEIKKDGNHITYLEVLESSGAISKLGPYKRKREFFTGEDFQKIKIGNEVTKVSSADSRFDSSFIDSTDDISDNSASNENPIEESIGIKTPLTNHEGTLNDQFKKLSENYVATSNQLAELIKEKNTLDSNCKKLEQQLETAYQENEQMSNKANDLDQENQSLLEANKSCSTQQCNEEIKKYKAALSEIEKKFKKIESLIEGK